MSRRLVPCAACLRHVVAAESACPFCGAARAADLRGPEGFPPRLRRAAAMAFAATVTACDPPKAPSAPQPEPTDAAATGAPITSATSTASTTAPSSKVEPFPDGNYDKPYGAPPVDGLLV
ncbi:MAG: hypothetical protein IPJ34_41805 [Myxococcales bacterium]|nr:hypothetical protein [Myxococcales bacterium]